MTMGDGGLMNQGVLHFDGECWPNPGPSACAYVLRHQTRIYQERFDLGHGTNNTAEFNGCLMGIEKAVSLGIKNLEVYGDSELVIKTLNLGWPLKRSPHLAVIKDRIKLLIPYFERIQFFWVPREQNQECDEVCRGYQ